MAVRLLQTQSTATNLKKFTLSMWIKRGKISKEQNVFVSHESASDEMQVRFNANDTLEFTHYPNYGSTGYQGRLITNRVFRDPAAWMHIVITYDSTQSTNTNRVKIYVQGVQETSFSTTDYPDQNTDGAFGTSSYQFCFGTVSPSSTNSAFDGLLTHAHFTDGYAYAASDFGESDSVSGIWKPKTAPSVTYGNNGFFLKFENSGAMGTDSSGNGNNFTVSTGTITQNIDTPSNNFATLNPLVPTAAALAAHANGFGNANLYNGDQSPNNWQSVPATFGLSTGKWYWELKDESDWGSTSDSTRRYGIADLKNIISTVSSSSDANFSDGDYAYAYMNASGIRHNGSTLSGTTSTHPTFQEGDFLMVAMDLTNLKLYFGKNGTWLNSGDPTSGSSGTGSVANLSSSAVYAPYVETKYGSDNVSLNFGQGFFRTASAGSNTDSAGIGKFKYTVPSGYYCICTKNIKDYG